MSTIIPVWCVGLSHKTASIELLERLSEHGGEHGPGLAGIENLLEKHLPGQPSVTIATCNRIELYWSHGRFENPAQEPCPFPEFSEAELLASMGLAPEETAEAADGRIYQYRGIGACRHLFEVAAGLDSLVVGEHQILGQIGRAYETAERGWSKSASPGRALLRELFVSAVRAGRRVRRDTGISDNSISLSSVAVDMARGVIGDIASASVVVAGTGEMGLLTMEALRGHGAHDIHVVNRTMRTAEAAAAKWGGRAYPLSELPSVLAAADILIASTGSDEPILDEATARAVSAAREGRPLVLVDIALPRDVAPAVGRVPGMHLYDLHHLQAQADIATKSRHEEIPRAMELLGEELEGFASRARELAVRPVLASVFNRANRIREQVLEQAREEIDDLREDQWNRIETMAQTIVNKLLHEPAVRLRNAAARDGAAEYSRTLRELFGEGEG